MVEKSRIVLAARELNRELGLEPRINVKLPEKELIKLVVEAGQLIEPEDDISKDTMNTLEDLAAYIESILKESEEEEVVEDVELKNQKGKKVQGGDEVPSKAPKKEKKRGVEITRWAAVNRVLEELKGQEFTDEDIIIKSQELYERLNGAGVKTGAEGQKYQWTSTKTILVDLGVVQENDGKYVYVFEKEV